MALSIDQIIRPQTEDEIVETMLSLLEGIGVRARSWRRGGMARVILRSFASQASALSVLITDAVKANYLDTATAEWLTLLAYYGYGVDRREATFATGQVTLTNTLGGVFEYGPDELLFVNPTTKKAYALASSFALTNPGDTATVDIRAVEIGAASFSPAGTITEMGTHLLGVTVTNAAPVVGIDAWSDDELRAVCRAKLSALSMRGPRGAYEYAVLTAVRTDGSPVNINRHEVSPSSSRGIVTVYVASPSGAPIQEDIDAVIENVERHARPDAVRCFVLAAVPKPITLNVTVWADPTPGVDASMLRSIVLQRFAEKVREYKIGGRRKTGQTQGYLFMDYLDGVITSAHPSIWEVDGLDEDVPLATGEVAAVVLNVTVRFENG